MFKVLLWCHFYSVHLLVGLARVAKAQDASTTTEAPGPTIGYVRGNTESPITCPGKWSITSSLTPSAPWGCCDDNGGCQGYYSTCIEFGAATPTESSICTDACPSVLSCSWSSLGSCVTFILTTGSDTSNPRISFGCLGAATIVRVSANANMTMPPIAGSIDSTSSSSVISVESTPNPSASVVNPLPTSSAPSSSEQAPAGDASKTVNESGGTSVKLGIILPSVLGGLTGVVIGVVLLLRGPLWWKKRKKLARLSNTYELDKKPSTDSKEDAVKFVSPSKQAAVLPSEERDVGALDANHAKRQEYKIAVLCAIPIESNSMLRVMDNKDENLGKHAYDGNSYTTGTISGRKVVLVHLAGSGQTNAGISAGLLLVSFPKIELALVAGICGGVPISKAKEEVFLGDLIISTSSVTGDFGRQLAGDFQRYDTVQNPSHRLSGLLHKIRSEIYQYRLQDDVRNKIQDIWTSRSESQAAKGSRHQAKAKRPPVDELFEPNYVHKHRGKGVCEECEARPENTCKAVLEISCAELDCDKAKIVKRSNHSEGHRNGHEHDYLQPQIHFGRIGSGNTLMRSGEHRDRIAWAENLIAFEMEGAAVDRVCDALIVKAVCDYADSHKNKSWQPYAADVAAAGVKALLTMLD